MVGKDQLIKTHKNLKVHQYSIRKKYLELIENNFDQLETDLKSLRASERVKAIIELSKFILPTLKATEMSLSNETKFQAIEIELK